MLLALSKMGKPLPPKQNYGNQHPPQPLHLGHPPILPNILNLSISLMVMSKIALVPFTVIFTLHDTHFIDINIMENIDAYHSIALPTILPTTLVKTRTLRSRDSIKCIAPFVHFCENPLQVDGYF